MENERQREGKGETEMDIKMTERKKQKMTERKRQNKGLSSHLDSAQRDDPFQKMPAKGG